MQCHPHSLLHRTLFPKHPLSNTTNPTLHKPLPLTSLFSLLYGISLRTCFQISITASPHLMTRPFCRQPKITSPQSTPDSMRLHTSPACCKSLLQVAGSGSRFGYLSALPFSSRGVRGLIRTSDFLISIVGRGFDWLMLVHAWKDWQEVSFIV